MCSSSTLGALQKIPEHVYPLIQPFLFHDDYLCFMNTSKALFSHIKRLTVYYSLTLEKSLQYCSDETFRNEILSKVVDGRRQIRLILNEASQPSMTCLTDFPVDKVYVGFTLDDKTFPFLQKVRRLQQYQGGNRINQSYDLSEIEELSFYSCPRSWVEANRSSFTNLKKLEFSDCSYLKSEDLQWFSAIPNLLLYRCSNIKDFSCLGPKQVKLSISDAPHLKDVVSFGNVKYLVLDGCENLEEIGSLKTVYDLTLTSCDLIKDLTQLRGHSIHNLVMWNCANECVGYEVLEGISAVRLGYCNIVEVSMLANARKVSLFSCYELMDVSPLRNVKEIWLQDCPKISSISELSSTTALTIENLPSLVCFPQKDSPLPVKSISWVNHPPLTDPHIEERFYEWIGEATSLIIAGYNGLSQILRKAAFDRLRELDIIECACLVNTQGLGKVHTLRLSFCRNLEDISDLGQGNHTVRLRDCPKIVDVSSLRNVSIVHITSCDRIVDYSCLDKVPRVKLHTK